MNNKGRILCLIGVFMLFLSMTSSSNLKNDAYTGELNKWNDYQNDETNSGNLDLFKSLYLTSATVNPLDSEVRGVGVNFDVTQRYSDEIKYITASKTVVTGIQNGSYSQSNIVDNDGISDTTNCSTNTNTQQTNSANSIIYFSGDSTGYTGSSLSNSLLYDDNLYVWVKDASPYVGTMAISIGNYPSFQTTGLDRARIYFEIMPDTNIGGLDNSHDLRIKFLLSDGYVAAATILAANPIDEAHYSGYLSISPSSYSEAYYRMISNNVYIQKIEVLMECSEEALTSCWINIDYYYIQYDYSFCYYDFNYEFNFQEFSYSILTELKISIDLEDTMSNTYFYLWNYTSSSYNSYIYRTTSNNAINFNVTYGSGFNQIINNNKIKMRIYKTEEIPYDVPYYERWIKIDQIKFDFKAFNQSTGSYVYYYNYTSQKPQFTSIVYSSPFNGFNPTNITITKPDLYSLAAIYNASDAEISSNPNKINGTEGTKNIVLTNFNSTWFSTGSLQFIFEAPNILNSSTLVKRKYMGIDYFEYISENISVAHYDELEYSIWVNSKYQSASFDNIICNITNDFGESYVNYGYFYGSVFEINPTIPADSYGLYNATFKVSITKDGKVEYIGYLKDINNLFIMQSIYFDTDFEENTGFVFYDEALNKFNYTFQFYGADPTADMLLIHGNKSYMYDNSQTPLVKYEISDIGSDDIFLTAIYANTSTFFNILYSNEIILTFEYFGSLGSGTVEIEEISLKPQIFDGLDANYYLYRNISINPLTIYSGVPKNISFIINHEDMINSQNIGIIPNSYDIYIKFKQQGSSNNSETRFSDIKIIPFWAPWAYDFQEIIYLNDTTEGEYSFLLEPSENENIILIYVSDSRFNWGGGVFQRFGFPKPSFTYYSENNRTYDNKLYVNGNINMTVNCSLLPDNDIRQIIYYQINRTDNGEVVMGYIPVDISGVDLDLKYFLFNFIIDLESLPSGDYQLNLIVADYLWQLTNKTIHLIIDKDLPIILPYGNPPGFSNQSLIMEKNSIKFNITELNPDFNLINYTLIGAGGRIILQSTISNLEPEINILGINEQVTIIFNLMDRAGNKNMTNFQLSLNNDGTPDITLSIPILCGNYLTRLKNPEFKLRVVDTNISVVNAFLYKDGYIIYSINDIPCVSGEFSYHSLGQLVNGLYKLNITAEDKFGCLSSYAIEFNASDNEIALQNGLGQYDFYKDENLRLNISFSTASNGYIRASPITNPQGLKNSLYLYSIETNAVFIGNATIRIYFDPNRIESLNFDINKLQIFYYNETQSKWIALSTVINTQENYAEITTDHCSLFALSIMPTPPPNPIVKWIIMIVLIGASTAMIIVVNVKYKSDEIKRYKRELKEFKDKQNSKRSDSDVEEIEKASGGNKIQEGKKIEDISQNTKPLSKSDYIKELVFQNPKEDVSLIDVVKQFNTEIKEYRKNLEENEQGFNTNLIDEATFKQNIVIISNIVNNIIKNTYEPLITEIRKNDDLYKELTYKRLHFVLLFDSKHIFYLKKYNSENISDELFNDLLVSINSLTLNYRDQNKIRTAVLIHDKLFYIAIQKIDQDNYSAIIFGHYPHNLYLSNFEKFAESCKEKLVYFKQIPLVINKIIDSYINTPQKLRDIEIDQNPYKAMKKCLVCGKNNLSNAKYCVNDNIRLFY